MVGAVCTGGKPFGVQRVVVEGVRQAVGSVEHPPAVHAIAADDFGGFVGITCVSRVRSVQGRSINTVVTDCLPAFF